MNKCQFSGTSKSAGAWAFTPKATKKEGSVMDFIRGMFVGLTVAYLVWIIKEIYIECEVKVK